MPNRQKVPNCELVNMEHILKKVPNCELVNMKHILENGFKKPIDEYKKPCNINKAIAVLDEIALDVLQKEVANTQPNDPFRKAYEGVIPNIQERINRRGHSVLPSFNGQIVQGPVNVLNNRNH